MTPNTNPLARFFRQPAIYIRLPSQGFGWAPGALNMPANQEIPVYPMTAIDEITYRTPDALLNGESVISVIQSCIPSVLNAWAVPATDLDAMLVAIRIASYGHEMDIDTVCPSCQEESNFGLDLRTVMDRMTAPDYSQALSLQDMTIFFRPLDYKEITENSQMQFEQQKTMQMVTQQEMSEEAKLDLINGLMKKVVAVTVHAIAQSISEIRTSDAIVTDREQIEEFLNNTDRVMFSQIRDHAVKLREETELAPLKIRCPSCKHEYEQSFTMDQARFFGSAS